MRAISLVKKIEFEFAGNVSRNALTLGDVDNDGCIELIIGNNEGEVAIFKVPLHTKYICLARSFMQLLENFPGDREITNNIRFNIYRMCGSWRC